MAALFQFSGVACAESVRPYSFTLHAGEARLLQVASAAAKDAVIDVAVGKMKCAESAVFVQGKPLRDCKSGCVGWVAANGGLISNLKVWENVTLPLWYHARHSAAETEQVVAHWLSALGMDKAEWETFMESPPDRLLSWQRKLAGLLRGLVPMPLVLVVDAALFEDVEPRLAQIWAAALENYAAQDRAVVAVADRKTAIPWKIIE